MIYFFKKLFSIKVSFSSQIFIIQRKKFENFYKSNSKICEAIRLYLIRFAIIFRKSFLIKFRPIRRSYYRCEIIRTLFIKFFISIGVRIAERLLLILSSVRRLNRMVLLIGNLLLKNSDGTANLSIVLFS